MRVEEPSDGQRGGLTPCPLSTAVARGSRITCLIVLTESSSIANADSVYPRGNSWVMASAALEAVQAHEAVSR